MALSTDLIKDFVRETNDTSDIKKEVTCYGTAVIVGDNKYVQLDGSEYYTPASYATAAYNGDRVLVLLKARSAVVIANITNPTIITGTLIANTGIIVNGYLTTNPNRVEYDDTTHTGLTFSNGGIGAYGGNNQYWFVTNRGALRAINADVAGKITANSGFIGTANNGFKIDSTGIYSGSSRTANTSGYISLSTQPFGRTIAGIDTTGQNNLVFAIGSKFGVDADGGIHASSADIVGKIIATSGYIGTKASGFHINSNGIFSGTYGSDTTSGSLSLTATDFNRSINETLRSGLRFAIGSNFGVSKTGALYASNVDISGKVVSTNAEITGVIKANTGYIGGTSGWTIKSKVIESVSDSVTESGTAYKYRMQLRSYSYADNHIALAVQRLNNDESLDVSRLLLYYNGKLESSDADISGKITAKSGNIAGFVISSTINNGTTTNDGHRYQNSLYKHSSSGNYEYEVGIKGASTSTDAAFYVTRITSGQAWTQANATLVFYVNHAGKLYATNAEITGVIKADTGYIGGTTGWTINSNVIQSVGTVTESGTTYKYRTQLRSYSYNNNHIALAIQKLNSDDTLNDDKILLYYNGLLKATNTEIEGKITATTARIKDEIVMYTEFPWGAGDNLTLIYKQIDDRWSYDVAYYSYNDGKDLSKYVTNTGWARDDLATSPNVIAYGLQISKDVNIKKNLYVNEDLAVGGRSLLCNGDVRTRYDYYGRNVYVNDIRCHSAIGSGGKAAWDDTANSGVWLTSAGEIHLSESSTLGGRIAFHYDFSANATSSITESGAAGTLVVAANYLNVSRTGRSDNVWVRSENKNFEVRMAAHNQAGIYCGRFAGVTTGRWLIYIQASGEVVVPNTSDRRYKNVYGLTTNEEALSVLREVNIVNFSYKEDTKGTIQNGIIAQELRDVLLAHNIGYRPYITIESSKQNDDTLYYDLSTPEEGIRYGVDYSKLVPLLWKGWQSHDERITTLEIENAYLKKGWQSHDERITALEIENAYLKEELKKLKGAA